MNTMDDVQVEPFIDLWGLLLILGTSEKGVAKVIVKIFAGGLLSLFLPQPMYKS